MENVEVNYLREYAEPAYDVPSPPDGKAWKSKKTNAIYTTGIKLGKLFFLNGEKLKTPIQEQPEDFELIDIEVTTFKLSVLLPNE